MSGDDEAPIKSDLIYTSVSANRLENGISCHGRYLLYSKCNCPVLYDLSKGEIAHMLLGHSQQVNGLKFVSRDNKASDDIISTSYDLTAKIWQPDEFRTKYINIFTLKSPDDSVFTARSALHESQHIVSITSTISGLICLWYNDELMQKFAVSYVGIDLRIHEIRIDDMTYYFLFVSGSDNFVHLYQLDDRRLEHIIDLWARDDWVKCLDTISLENMRPREFLVAAASQDFHVKIWQIAIRDSEDEHNPTGIVGSQLIRPHSQKLRLIATLETNLLGHDASVSSLCWLPIQSDRTLQLASCSADKKVVVWKSSIETLSAKESEATKFLSDQATKPWKVSHEFGETGEMNLPFVGICVSTHKSLSLYCQSLRGAIHSWYLNDDGKWKPDSSITGHHDVVSDLSWESGGKYLISSSHDKTCRIHGIASCDSKWHELARPQVHGHEVNCVSSLNFAKFASGAEEKTIRAYGATQFFLKSFKNIATESLPIEIEKELDQHPIHAQLPALGLSIRGADSPYDTDESTKNVAGQSNVWQGTSDLALQLAEMDHLEVLPNEEILTQSTLWWETNKLFGHGIEMYAIATDANGSYMASASKANRPDLAAVIVWECSQFRKAAMLEHHSLTVTRLSFSPNCQYLLSVSRDRTWCVSERTGKARPAFQKLLGTKKSTSMHERIIWDCSWTHDSEYFITVSRDKKAIMWPMEEIRSLAESAEATSQTFTKTTMQTFKSSIQAVDRAPFKSIDGSYVFAFGLEDGSLELHRVFPQEDRWERLLDIPSFHHLPIRRLAFKPADAEQTPADALLASGGEDGIVKLTKISMTSII